MVFAGSGRLQLTDGKNPLSRCLLIPDAHLQMFMPARLQDSPLSVIFRKTHFGRFSILSPHPAIPCPGWVHLPRHDADTGACRADMASVISINQHCHMQYFRLPGIYPVKNKSKEDNV